MIEANPYAKGCGGSGGFNLSGPTLQANSAVLDLSNFFGSMPDGHEWRDAYSLGDLVPGGNATRLLNTTGKSSFPPVVGAILNNSSPFAAGKLYRMEVYTHDGVTAEYSFILLRDA